MCSRRRNPVTEWLSGTQMCKPPHAIHARRAETKDSHESQVTPNRKKTTSLDQSTSERLLKRTLSEKALQFNCKLFFRCANPIMILPEGAQMISQRFARMWCVVVLRTTWSTSSLINGPNLNKFTEKLSHQFTAQYFMVHSATTRKLHTTNEHLGTPTSTLNNYRSLNCPLVQNVPEFNDPLRQLHRSKDGVEVISTCTASEWRMNHVESVKRMLTDLWTRPHPKVRWKALCKYTRQNLTLNSVPLRPLHRDSTRRC